MSKTMRGLEEEKPLFESIKPSKRRVGYGVYVSTVMVGIVLIWFFRVLNVPKVGEEGRLAWFGMFIAEVWFGVYWIVLQPVRFNVVKHFTFKDVLSMRYAEKLPGVDIFICTADPTMEPPTMVMNTVLSAMSYNYPPEKLSVYLSDDAGSYFTFYALLQASNFSKYWIPFCRKFNVEPRNPQVYFAQTCDGDSSFGQEWCAIKTKYDEMKDRIESVITKGQIPEELKHEHKGFSEWNDQTTKQNHHPIVQIIIDGRDRDCVDKEGSRLPTLVYMAREKRPEYPHNFKAGAVNSLIRVSSEISNGSIIVGLDCDMYPNNADAIREALCFFMDEKRGHEIAFVQHPQIFNNVTRHDIYSNNNHVVNQVELAGIGGYGAALYCGTGCFHRRVSLSGGKYGMESKEIEICQSKKSNEKSVYELEESSKVLASCEYEKDTKWGKEMGLVYGCAVEDIVTGLSIQCRGWKSIYYNPKREAFLGVAPTTLDISLLQFTRWSEGLFHVFFSKYCPFIYGHGKIKLGAQMGYSIYLLWATLSLPTIYYMVVPPLYLLHGFSFFPKVSSLWFIPFSYVFITKTIYSWIEALNAKSTPKKWWNLQRMWMIRRTTAYLFAFIEVITKQLGLTKTSFTLTTKVVTEDVSKRYEQEMIEFGSSSILFTILATLSSLNMLCLVGSILKMIFVPGFSGFESLVSQVFLCGVVVMLSLPVYEAMLLRKDKGCLPFSLVVKSVSLAMFGCLLMHLV